MGHHGHFKGCSLNEKCRCEIARYKIVIVIITLTLALEIVGSVISNSLALFSDALHVGIDLTSVILALVIEYRVLNKHQAKKNKIRGWGGILSSLLLVATLIPITLEAIERFIRPEDIKSTQMIIFAIFGLVGNAICLRILRHSHQDHVTHVSLTAHVVSDLAQSVGVVVAGITIMLTGWIILDPLTSVLIVLLLSRITYKTFKQSIGALKAN